MVRGRDRWRNHFSSPSANSAGRCDRHENADNGTSWEHCSEASRKPLTSGPDPACAGSPRGPGPGRSRRWERGDGGGSGETPEQGGEEGGNRPDTPLASGQKAEGSSLSPEAASLLPELNGFTEHTNQEEQFLSALINNPEHLPHTRRCLRGWGGGGDGEM